MCSRKAADAYVKRGLVRIDGTQAKLGDKVGPHSTVTVGDTVVRPLSADNFIFIALNKPVGIVCTAAKNVENNIVNYVDHPSRIYPVGRLDRDSQGLIFLTNRCELVDKILQGRSFHEKEYRVTVNKTITDDFISGLCGGVPMLGTVTKKCLVKKCSEFEFSITLAQGLNRQIRRMCRHFNYSVTKLERIRIMNIRLAELEIGQWRYVSEHEMATLLSALSLKLPR